MWRKTISISEPLANLAGDPERMAQARHEMQSSLDATLDVLERAGLRVLVLGPNPEMIYSPPLCIGLRRGERCNITRAANDAFIGDPTAALAEVVSRHPNSRLAEMTDFFCDADTCYAMRDEKILYTDDNHISATAARDLARFFARDMNWLLGKTGGAS